MALLKLAFVISLLSLTGCQMGYLLENAYHQSDLLLSREPIEEALKSGKLSQEKQRKLKLAQEAKLFAENHLGLKSSRNYTSYVELDGPYVVHSLTVAPKDELKPYTWWFPFFGKFPYLGYFNKRSAKMAQKKFQDENYDTYLRGVTAFSSLGWFNDPVLSSMMRYSDYGLVNVIIHETVHATIYIKDHVDFNERLATFIGNKGAELFYRRKEGSNSKTLTEAENENHDDEVFSDFISKEMKALKQWYSEQEKPIDEKLRTAQFESMKSRFRSSVMPLMKSKYYDWFGTARLNNARLLSYHTYYKDLSDFEKAYVKLGSDFKKLIEYAKQLEGSDNPEEELKNFATKTPKKI